MTENEVPEIPVSVDADILETGTRSDLLPEWLEVREPCVWFGSHNHCRFRKLGPFDSRSSANQNMIA